MLQLQTIAPKTYTLLKNLSSLEILANTRLVGGTSLALQYGHRTSIDLDFFGNFDCDQDQLTIELKKIGNVKVVSLTKNIRIYIIDGVKVDIVNYDYPWIDDPVEFDGVKLASDKDIAAMKINAVMGRGTKKDFIDVYFLLQKYSLKELLDLYLTKYTDGSLFRALLSLNYFDDANSQPLPEMFVNVEWEEIKNAISSEVKEIEEIL